MNKTCSDITAETKTRTKEGGGGKPLILEMAVGCQLNEGSEGEMVMQNSLISISYATISSVYSKMFVTLGSAFFGGSTVFE